MNDIYNRQSNETHQFWTLPYVPGKRLAETDVYLLTSTRTFSGAEDFTYGLKNLKRVTVVGEVTGGGAASRQAASNHQSFRGGGAVRPLNQRVHQHGLGGRGRGARCQSSSSRALATAHLMALEKRARPSSMIPNEERGRGSDCASQERVAAVGGASGVGRARASPCGVAVVEVAGPLVKGVQRAIP